MEIFNNKEELIETLRAAIAEEFELDESVLALDAPIKETLELDSLNLVDLVVLIEKVTGVKTKGMEVIKVVTFEELYVFVWSLL